MRRLIYDMYYRDEITQDVAIKLLDQLEKDLLKGERKVEVWADSIGVSTINIEYKKPDPFFNINTKEDLKKAKEMMNND